jgi:hypothetical protein
MIWTDSVVAAQMDLREDIAKPTLMNVRLPHVKTVAHARIISMASPARVCLQMDTLTHSVAFGTIVRLILVETEACAPIVRLITHVIVLVYSMELFANWAPKTFVPPKTRYVKMEVLVSIIKFMISKVPMLTVRAYPDTPEVFAKQTLMIVLLLRVPMAARVWMEWRVTRVYACLGIPAYDARKISMSVHRILVKTEEHVCLQWMLFTVTAQPVIRVFTVTPTSMNVLLNLARMRAYV